MENKANLLGGFNNIPQSSLDDAKQKLQERQGRCDKSTLKIKLQSPNGGLDIVWYNQDSNTWECMDSRFNDSYIRQAIQNKNLHNDNNDNHTLLAGLTLVAPVNNLNDMVSKSNEIALLVKHDSWGAAEGCQNQLATMINKWIDALSESDKLYAQKLNILNMCWSFGRGAKNANS